MKGKLGMNPPKNETGQRKTLRPVILLFYSLNEIDNDFISHFRPIGHYTSCHALSPFLEKGGQGIGAYFSPLFSNIGSILGS